MKVKADDRKPGPCRLVMQAADVAKTTRPTARWTSTQPSKKHNPAYLPTVFQDGLALSPTAGSYALHFTVCWSQGGARESNERSVVEPRADQSLRNVRRRDSNSTIDAHTQDTHR
jgi:hypothetical protein